MRALRRNMIPTMNRAQRLLLILVVASVAFALPACGDSTESDDTATLPPTTEPQVEQGDATTVTSPSAGEPQRLSGDLTFAGQAVSLVSGCIDTFDTSGTGTVTGHMLAPDGTRLEFVFIPNGEPTVTILQEERIWSNLGTAVTVEVNAEAGSLTGRGSLVEGRTTSNPDPDDAAVAVEFSAAWDPANPCP